MPSIPTPVPIVPPFSFQDILIVDTDDNNYFVIVDEISETSNAFPTEVVGTRTRDAFPAEVVGTRTRNAFPAEVVGTRTHIAIPTADSAVMRTHYSFPSIDAGGTIPASPRPLYVPEHSPSSIMYRFRPVELPPPPPSNVFLASSTIVDDAIVASLQLGLMTTLLAMCLILFATVRRS